VSDLQAEVRDRFGVLPNFFLLAEETPEITAKLWGFASFAYLDNPLPSLFKERLFVYLSRFCEVRYCIARHVGFLTGLGRPSGDPRCPPETVDEALRLLGRPVPRWEALAPHIALLEARRIPLARLVESGTPLEEALFACVTHTFLHTAQAGRCLEALRRALDAPVLEFLTLFLSYVRSEHFWTRLHPELEIEDDLHRMLRIHGELAAAVLNDPEATACDTTVVIVDELHALRRERALLGQDLQNLLAPTRSTLDTLRRFGDDEKTREIATEMIGRNLVRVARLVDELVEAGRVTPGRSEPRREPLAAASHVRHIHAGRFAAREDSTADAPEPDGAADLDPWPALWRA